MTIVNSFTIDRDGREYSVDVMVDESPSNPRVEYDHDATQFLVMSYTYNRWDTYVDELDGEAGEALKHFITPNPYGDNRKADEVERRFAKWRVITGSPVALVIGGERGYSQGDWFDWYALVDTAVMERDGYGGTPAEVAKAEADEYAAYAYGDVFGVSVTSPDGDEESVWQVVDRHGKYVREVADELADNLESIWHEREAARLAEANRVGAGFVGVI